MRSGDGNDGDIGPAIEPVRARRSARVPVRAGIGVGIVAAAVAAAVALAPTQRQSSTTQASVRMCPWHSVMADGAPPPLLIADAPGPDGKQVGLYGPGQVFYAAEPPTLRDGMLRTADGWIGAGDWIRRDGGPCVMVPQGPAEH